MSEQYPYQLLPPLAPDEYEALKESIRETGVQIPIEVDEDGNILDGHHRNQICLELGIDPPFNVRSGLTEVEKRSLARALNTIRRHLNQAQKREVIADELRENPSESNNAIAKRLGVSDTTVGAVRAALGDEVASEYRTGADGKIYPALHQRTVVEAITPEEATGFLDRFMVDEPKDERFEIPVERRSGPQYFQVSWALLEPDRDVVAEAIQGAKKRNGLRNSSEALLFIMNDYLKNN